MPNDQIALLEAIAKDDLEHVKFLIYGKQISPIFLYNGRSPIVEAVLNGREDILCILIESKCDLDTPDYTDHKWRKRPIHIAAAKGYTGCVKKLVENNVSVESLDNEGRTPIHWAASFGHIHTIQYLISVGCNVNASQIDGFTPLHCTAALNHHEASRVILSHGADVNATDDDGWSSIHHAAAYGHFSVVKVLHEAGASLKLKTPINDNILHVSSYTIKKQKVEIIRYLVENEVPLDEKDGEGNTALHIACTHNCYDIAKCLIELGADLYASDDSSPFFTAACEYYCQDIIMLLINSGYNCSRERWIHEERYPPSLVNNPSLVSVLKYYASMPRTLQALSCFCILKHLRNYSQENIDLLPIPNALRFLLKNTIK